MVGSDKILFVFGRKRIIMSSGNYIVDRRFLDAIGYGVHDSYPALGLLRKNCSASGDSGGNQSTNQSISFNETKNRLKVPADTAAAGTVQWQG